VEAWQLSLAHGSSLLELRVLDFHAAGWTWSKLPLQERAPDYDGSDDVTHWMPGETIRLLVAALQRLPRLTRLHLGFFPLQLCEGSAPQLRQALAALPRLASLQLQVCGPGYDWDRHPAEAKWHAAEAALAVLPRGLAELELRGVSKTLPAALGLSVPTRLPRLTRLSLRSCRITAADAAQLAAALRCLQRLQFLDLSNNALTASGSEPLGG
jgi:hypothetical protein